MCPPRRLHGAPNATPSPPRVPSRGKKTSHTFFASITFTLRHIRARQTFATSVRRTRTAFGRFSPTTCLLFDPRCPSPLPGACAGLGALDHYYPRAGLLIGVTSTCPGRPLHRSPASIPTPTAKTLPSSSSDSPHWSWPAPVTSDPLKPTHALSLVTSPPRMRAMPPEAINTPVV